MRMIQAVLLILCFIFYVSPISAATLFDCDWDAGTGCSVANVRGGSFTDGGTGTTDCSATPCDCFNVASGGVGGRNKLEIKMPTTGGAGLTGHTSFENPDPIYVRYWFYVHAWVSTFHPMIIGWEPGPTTGDGVYILRLTSSGISIFNVNLYRYDGILELDTWYRFEAKISGGGTASGSVEVRIDGVDVSDTFAIEGGDSLADDAGTMNLNACNYIALQTYDRESNEGSTVDISGLKVTDDGWIGGDDDAALNGVVPTGITIQ